MPAPSINVFIVEDSLLILESLAAMLEEMAPVSVVGSAQSESGAVEQLQRLGAQLDLVIVDIFLQSGSGLGVLRKVAQQGLKAKRIVLSNYATAEMWQRCHALGADCQFDKSRDIEKLVAYCAAMAAERGVASGQSARH